MDQLFVPLMEVQAVSSQNYSNEVLPKVVDVPFD